MIDVAEIKYVKDSNKFNQDEIELCCMIAIRFTNNDLIRAASEFKSYMKNSKFLPRKEIKDLIDEWAHERFGCVV